jgi:hypothetical protein
MTVNNAAGKITYLGNGSTTAFTFSFSTPDAQSIKVIVVDSNGVVSLQPPGSYSVVLNPLVGANPTPAGGVVNFPLVGPPLPAGSTIVIVRVLDVIQPVSLSNQQTLYPIVIEKEFDYLTMLDQSSSENATRAFTANIVDPVPTPTMPVAQRANHFVYFDANGDLVPGATPVGTAIISAAMEPVVAAATTAIALQLLGVQALIDAIFTTGDLKPTHKAVADPGWIMWIDGTIGDASSGSTVRANADTINLFGLYYNNCNDTDCPLLTSAGAATTRAAQGLVSAAFNNHCRMTIPKAAGRSLAVAGFGMGLTNRTLGSLTGVESSTPSIATMAAHLHQPDSSLGGYPFLGDGSSLGLGYLANADFSGPNNIVDMTMTVVGGGQPTNTMQPTTFINVMVRL